MKKAAIPENETARLQALHTYRILDTAPEKAFDDLAQLASYICKTPVALVSLIDGSRQWFKANIGLGVPQTDRNIAFCAHAILDDKLFIVSDTHNDERFADNPLVTSNPNIRFYAGAPLINDEG